MSEVKPLFEETSAKLTLTEDKKTGRWFARGPFGYCGQKTANNRRYSKAIMESNFQRLEEGIGRRRVFGELDHPSTGKTSLKRVSHVITKLEIAEDGTVDGEAEILDTPNGRIFKKIVEAECEVGISSRGVGTTKVAEDGVEDVQDNFRLKTYDFVADPAAGVFPEAIQEDIAAIQEDVVQALTFEGVVLDDIPDVIVEALREGQQCKLREELRGELLEELKSELDEGEAKAFRRVVGLCEGEVIETLDEGTSVEDLSPEDAEALLNTYVESLKTKAAEAENLTEAVKPGTYFAVVDIDVPGGKLLEGPYKGVKKADQAAEKYRPKKNVQIIDALWYNPARAKLKAAGMVEDEIPDVELDIASLITGGEEDYQVKLAEEKERLSAELVLQLESLRDTIRAEIREELELDTDVARLRGVMEQIAGAIRPFLTDDNDQKVQTLQDQIDAYDDAVRNAEFETATARLETEEEKQKAERVKLEAKLTESLAGHPKAERIRTMLGPIDRIKDETELEGRLSVMFEELGKPDIENEKFKGEVEKQKALAEKREEKLQDELGKLKESHDELHGKLARAVEIGMVLDARNKAAGQVIGRRDAVSLWDKIEEADNEKAVTRILEDVEDERNINEDEEAARIRSRTKRGFERNRKLEESRHENGEGGTVLGQSMSHMRTLAGI